MKFCREAASAFPFSKFYIPTLKSTSQPYLAGYEKLSINAKLKNNSSAHKKNFSCRIFNLKKLKKSRLHGVKVFLKFAPIFEI